MSDLTTVPVSRTDLEVVWNLAKRNQYHTHQLCSDDEQARIRAAIENIGAALHRLCDAKIGRASCQNRAEFVVVVDGEGSFRCRTHVNPESAPNGYSVKPIERTT